MAATIATRATTPATAARGSTKEVLDTGVWATCAGEDSCELEGLNGAMLPDWDEGAACWEEPVDVLVTVTVVTPLWAAPPELA